MSRTEQVVKRRRGGQVHCWLATSLTRIFPTTVAGGAAILHLQAARNSRLAFQICLQNQSLAPLQVTCSAEEQPGLRCQVRRVGYVPLWQHTTETALEYLDGLNALPGLTPDPLYPEPHAQVGPFANQSFWVSVTIAGEVAPGHHVLTVRLAFAEEKAEVAFTVELSVSALVLKPRRNFPVTHWWRAEAIWDWYRTEPFDERWWQIVEPYLSNLRNCLR